MQVQSLGRDDPLEEGTATHSGILAWRIPWTEEPDGLCPQGHEESDTTEAMQQTHSPAMQADSLPTEPSGKPISQLTTVPLIISQVKC